VHGDNLLKYLNLLVIASFLTFVCINTVNAEPVLLAQKDKNIDFGNVDKKVEGWKYFLNGKEVPYLPEIYLAGNAKYVPVEIVKNLGASLVFDTPARTAYITNNDQSFIIKENSKQIYVNNKSFLISDEPVWKNNTLYVSTKFLGILGILISENKYQNELNIVKSFNIINDFKVNIDNTENKITFNLNALPVYDTESGSNYYKVTLFGSAVLNPEKFKSQLQNLSSDFKKVDFDNSKDGIITITFYTKGETGIVNTYYLEAPGRLVVQFPKIYKDEFREMISSGLSRTKIAEGNYQGPLRINLLEVNPNRNLIKPVVSRDEKQNFTLREVSRFGKDFNAVAGVNGGYFSLATKFPLGLIFSNGELISAPIYNRSALLINKDNTFTVKNIDLNIFLNAYDADGKAKQIKVNAYNLPPQKNQLVLFTYNYGKDNLNKKVKKEEPKNEDFDLKNEEIKDEVKNNEPEPEFSGYLISKKGGKLTKLNDFNGSIPAGNYVLYASGSAKDNLEKAIQNSSNYDLTFNYSQPLDNVLYAIGGGPTLVRDGTVNVTAKEEKFKADITDGKAPRTAVSILKNGKILIFTVDGRSENSKGMDLDELASFLKQYDAKEAVNFDGGGSTAMFLNGQLINTVSDPKERKVSNSLLIFKK
jgi:exopolysaccharide biosynthesis protein